MAAQSRDGGSFLTGFGVGILAGAVGYFLKHSDQGEEFQKKFAGEWSTAQQFVREELKETSPLTVQGAFDEVIRYLAGEDEAEEEPEDSAKPTRSTTTRKKRTPKFKGV